MTDIKIIDGDVYLDSGGRPERLGDTDAKFQRAVICATVRKGSFIYDRALGCDYDTGAQGELLKREAELGINEALARFENTSAKALSVGENILLRITIDGESRTEEVRLIGNV